MTKLVVHRVLLVPLIFELILCTCMRSVAVDSFAKWCRPLSTRSLFLPLGVRSTSTSAVTRSASVLLAQRTRVEHRITESDTFTRNLSLNSQVLLEKRAVAMTDYDETTEDSSLEQERVHSSFLSSESFQDRNDLHKSSKRALKEVLNLTSMTEIQLKTFAAASSGKDVLGRAKTGTGKTLAFLIPALERILQEPPKHKDTIGILIISPTRELASQIAGQAEKLLTYHAAMSVQVMFGGTNVKTDVRNLEKRIPTILVATPGRLLDHLQSTNIRNQSFGNVIMSRTPLVVLDETDRLLDMGFRREIEKILSYLPPKEKRQTLLFSATIPKELKRIMAQNMKSDFIEVNCIHDGDADTCAKVQESHVIIPTMDRYLSSIVEIVYLAMKQQKEAKIVVFFPTARMVAFCAELFNDRLGIPVIELHSKKSQNYRNKASDDFRAAKSAVLFTSDVSARGVDYPGVTQVIQFGMPDSRDQYIHRLGRTGRAGADGKGWLVLGPFENRFLHELHGLDIPQNDQLVKLLSDPMDPHVEKIFTIATNDIRANTKLQSSASGAYQAFLGYYLGKMKAMKMNKKEDLVAIANTLSGQMGLSEIPSLTKNMISKMGLKGVDGISFKVESVSEDANQRKQPHGGGARPHKKMRSDQTGTSTSNNQPKWRSRDDAGPSKRNGRRNPKSKSLY